MIKFTEDRILIDGSTVSAGEERSFSPEDEAAFIANGVAIDATAKPAASKPAAVTAQKED